MCFQDSEATLEGSVLIFRRYTVSFGFSPFILLCAFLVPCHLSGLRALQKTALFFYDKWQAKRDAVGQHLS